METLTVQPVLPIPSVDDLRSMPIADVEKLVQQADAARRVAESSMALLMSQVEQAGAHKRDGHRTPRALGMGACNWSWADAGRVVQSAHLLAVFPSAFGLGVAQLHALAAVVANPRVQPFLAAAEELLVGQAHVLDFDDYVVFLTHWVNTVDPDGSEAAFERAHRERDAKVAVVGERGYLNASGGAAPAAFMAEVLAAYTDTEFMADWDVACVEHGDDTCAAHLARTDRQRRADALHAIFTAAAQARAGSGDEGGFTVNIVVDEATFERQLLAAVGAPAQPVDPTQPVDVRAMISRTASGIELDPRDVLVAALLGHVRRVVRNSAGVVVDVGRRQRLFTGAVREAILALNPKCMWPGDRHRARQVDHLRSWARGGGTDACNGGPACGLHNRWRTRGYHTCRGPDGEWHHFRPDGSELGWRGGYLVRIAPPMAMPAA